MKNLMYFLVASLLMMSCNSTTSEGEGNDIIESDLPISFEGKHCFLETLPHEPFVIDGGDTIQFIDSTVLQLEITGNQVKGIFNWMPAERDQAYGTLEGTIKDNIITALYSYTIEGEHQQEEKVFQLRKDAIAVKTGELEENAKGVLKLKDIDKAEFNEVLLKVPCN